MGKKIFISGKALSVCRINSGLTQEELAEKLHKTRVTITGWEAKEKISISEKELETLKTLLKVNTNDLTIVPHGTQLKEGDLADHPLVQSYVAQINLQKEIINMLKKDLDECRSGKK